MNAGFIFGPIITKWYQFLQRLQFKTPLRAVIYRVRLFPCTRTTLQTKTLALPQTYLDQGVLTPGWFRPRCLQFQF